MLFLIKSLFSTPFITGGVVAKVLAYSLEVNEFELQSRYYVHFKLILFTNPSARAGYDTRLIFKRSLTGLNSEFFLLLD